MLELSKVKTINVDPSILNPYLGTYLFTNNSIILITKSGDTMFIQRGENMDKLSPKIELLPYKVNKFLLENKRFRFVFDTNQKAQAQIMTVYYNETIEITIR